MSDDLLLIGRDLPANDETEHETSGAQRAAQDAIEHLLTPVGSLPWDPPHGSTFTTFLNSYVRAETVIAEVERVTAEADGVLAQTVHGSYDARQRKYRVRFVHESSALPVDIAIPTT